jgi:ABC-2 type transport system ATP-binding protein
MSETILQVRCLTKSFGTVLAVDHLSLEVARGEIFGFLGPNGAGKTTSINMMVGLLEPTSGEVLVEGQSIRRDRGSALNHIGVCPQENILWEKLTCLEQLEFMGANYSMPRRKARQHGGELLEALGLAAKANELAGRLSGGMKRRLNLALALIHDPHIVFLDEPEAGLDPQSRVLVREYIRLLARRKTVILTTHNMDEAERLADRVAIIDHGQLLVVDTPAALKHRLGEGTVLEIAVAEGLGQDTRQPDQLALQCVQEHFPDASWASGILTIRGSDLAARLPELLGTLQEFGLKPGNMHMRAVTLEDVFLSFTGRGLRE